VVLFLDTEPNARSGDFRYAAALPKSLTQSGTRRRLVSTRRIRWASGPGRCPAP